MFGASYTSRLPAISGATFRRTFFNSWTTGLLDFDSPMEPTSRAVCESCDLSFSTVPRTSSTLNWPRFNKPRNVDSSSVSASRSRSTSRKFKAMRRDIRDSRRKFTISKRNSSLSIGHQVPCRGTSLNGFRLGPSILDLQIRIVSLKTGKMMKRTQIRLLWKNNHFKNPQQQCCSYRIRNLTLSARIGF